MSSMFNRASAFNEDINTKVINIGQPNEYTAWNTSNVTNMIGMFSGASSFNQNIGNWGTSNVTNMSGMFNEASAFNEKINTKVINVGQPNEYTVWDTGRVVVMRGMFNEATAFNQDIGEWDTSNVTDMSEMFSGAEVFGQYIRYWNVGASTIVTNMFQDAWQMQNIYTAEYTGNALQGFGDTPLYNIFFNQPKPISYKIQDVTTNIIQNTQIIQMFRILDVSTDISAISVEEINNLYIMNNPTKVSGINGVQIQFVATITFANCDFDDNSKWSESDKETLKSIISGVYQTLSWVNTNKLYISIVGSSIFVYFLEIEARYLPVPICFPAGTPVTTDQGNVAIELIDTDIHTINGNKIVAITQTTAPTTHIISIQKHALGHNIPSSTTHISQDHRVRYKDKMYKARELVDLCENVTLIPYNRETLFNVLLDKHDKMTVNNLICETLNPNNIIAKLINSKLPKYQIREIKEQLSRILRNKDIPAYKAIYKSL